MTALSVCVFQKLAIDALMLFIAWMIICVIALELSTLFFKMKKQNVTRFEKDEKNEREF